MKAKQLIIGLLFLINLTVLYSQTTVSIDFKCQKYIGNVSALNREQYFNLHDSYSDWDFSVDDIKYLKNDLGISFGRAFGAPAPALLTTFPTENEIKTQGQNSISATGNNPRVAAFKTAEMVYTNHPKSVFKWKGLNANYDQEASYISNWFKYNFGTYNGQTIPMPKYYEPINECFVHASEFGHPNNDQVMEEMMKFHLAVADHLHVKVPGLKIGGPSEAWAEPDFNNFNHWNTRMKKFMDITNNKMDFYITHIYDGKNVAGGDKYRSGSNAEALMDISNAYGFIKYGEVKPQVISEYGITRPDWEGTDYDTGRDGKIIRSVNNLLMQFLNRPDRIEKSIPFIVGRASWYNDTGNKPYPWVISRKVNGQWQWTHLTKFYEMWKNVSGSRVKVYASDPDILVNAFVNGNKAYLAIDNLEFNSKSVNLSFLTNLGTPQSVLLKKVSMVNNVPVFTSTTFTGNNLSLDAEQTIVLEYTFANPIIFSATEKVTAYYANKYLLPITANQELQCNINNVVTGSGRAILKMGLGRELKASKKPVLKVNGMLVTVPDDWMGTTQNENADASGNGTFFGVIEIPVPMNILANNNTISLVFDTTGGHVSSLILSVEKLETSLSVQDDNFEKKSWLVYPNPVKNQLNINGLDDGDESFNISDINGKIIIRDGKLIKNTIDVSQLQSGFYFITTLSNKKIKFIKE